MELAHQPLVIWGLLVQMGEAGGVSTPAFGHMGSSSSNGGGWLS